VRRLQSSKTVKDVWGLMLCAVPGECGSDQSCNARGLFVVWEVSCCAAPDEDECWECVRHPKHSSAIGELLHLPVDCLLCTSRPLMLLSSVTRVRQHATTVTML
jgi:hypothetical protein